MSSLFERFSSKENLKKAYDYVQNELKHSSLSVNPINHPATTAIDDLGEQFFAGLEKYIRDGRYKPEKGFFVYMPKDNLGLRPICVLSMVDRIVYQAIFNQEILGSKIDGQLSDKVCFANRVNENKEDENFLSLYYNGYDNFCKEQIKAFKKGYVWKLEVDVQQYYEHIPIESLMFKLRTDFDIRDDKILSILKEQLCTWTEYSDLPKGIPQGPAASALLSNVFLASLDDFAEDELIGKGLRYMRYADDITIMGKSKEDVLKATEKIVRLLRDHNLTLNEKTKLAKLESTATIDAMRFLPDYDDDPQEIPEDSFAGIQTRVPGIISSIESGQKIDKLQFKELKYFLRIGMGYDLQLIMRLIGIIPLYPSLTVLIVQYVAESRAMLTWISTSPKPLPTDPALWQIYKKDEVSIWSRFWIFKLLVSNKDANTRYINREVDRILTSKDNTIFKIACFYYQAIHEKKIDIDQVKQAIQTCKTDVEKSLYSFFLLNAFRDVRTSTAKSYIEKLLNSKSHELNLIGCYLYKNKPKVQVDDLEDTFSRYILKLPVKNRVVAPTPARTPADSGRLFMIREENLIPIPAPGEILGISRPKTAKQTTNLVFPEPVKWEKITLKIKEGLQDMEIWYGKEHIKTPDYRDLGFYSGKKERKPDRQWIFLLILSYYEATDIRQATVSNMMSSLAKETKKSISAANVHQIKRTLVKALRYNFKTTDNPFYEHKDYYEPRFKLLPEPTMRTEELRKQGGRLNENINYDEDEVDE